MTNKKFKFNKIILSLFTCLILIFIFKDNYHLILDALSKANYRVLFLAFIMIFLVWMGKAFSLFVLSKDQVKIKFKDILKEVLIVNFFDGVTPFASGGEPMQIYMLAKHDLGISKATNIVFQNYLVDRFIAISLVILAGIINVVTKSFPYENMLIYLTIIGFILNVLVIILMILVTFSKKTGNLLIHFALKILVSLKLIKDQEEKKEDWEEKISHFQEGSRSLLKNKAILGLSIITNLYRNILLYIIPWLVIKSIQPSLDINLITVFIATTFVSMIAAFVPIPGGTGGSEYSFIIFFNYYVPQDIIVTILLVWRFITYYLGIIIGGIFLNIYNRKERKNENIIR